MENQPQKVTFFSTLINRMQKNSETKPFVIELSIDGKKNICPISPFTFNSAKSVSTVILNVDGKVFLLSVNSRDKTVALEKIKSKKTKKAKKKKVKKSSKNKKPKKVTLKKQKKKQKVKKKDKKKKKEKKKNK